MNSPAGNVHYTVHNHVAKVRIDRPERRNAMAFATSAALVDAFERAAADPEVWTILLTGTGDKAFCAGVDLKEIDELARQGKPMTMPMMGPSRNVFEVILETTKPTVAAINGAALGAGCELALACDIRLAASDAVMGLPEALRGMGANFGSVLLPRLIPRATALELLYTGRFASADEARQIGLVNHVYARDCFDRDVDAFVAAIAANAPLTLQRYKHMALKGWELPVPSALRLNAGPNPYLSEDRVEGVRAFVEKRAPRWTGR